MRKHILLVLFLLGSSYPPVQAQDSSASLTYLALGDSYTIGESVPDSMRWPVQLVEKLRKRDLGIQNPRILATTGWTTLDLQHALTRADLNPPYDLVSLLIGVNDQYQGKDIEAYPANFRHLLNTAIRLADNNPERVLVLSIPDYGVTPFGQKKNPSTIARELDRYNQINKQISDSLGVRYVNITPISKKAATDRSLVAPDGLHPSGEMYRLWAEKAVPEILPVLRHHNHKN